MSAAELLYEAESAAVAEIPLRRFRRFVHLESYIQALVLGNWWSDTFPSAPLEVHVERRSSGATYSAAQSPTHGVGVLHLVDGSGWGLESVLHELAHLAAGVGHGHDERFRRALLELWRHEAGIDAWASLRSAIDERFADC